MIQSVRIIRAFELMDAGASMNRAAYEVGMKPQSLYNAVLRHRGRTAPPKPAVPVARDVIRSVNLTCPLATVAQESAIWIGLYIARGSLRTLYVGTMRGMTDATATVDTVRQLDPKVLVYLVLEEPWTRKDVPWMYRKYLRDVSVT